MAVVRALVLCVSLVAFFVVFLSVHACCRVCTLAPPRGLLRAGCRLMLGLLGVRVAVAGSPGSGARLIVANHVSWLDILVLGSVESPCFLAKQEVSSWPLISALAALNGTVFMDRSRRRQIPRVNRELGDRLRHGESVLLFPEGTTHDGQHRGRFLTSHLACLRDQFAQAPALLVGRVQAAALGYSDPGAAWVGDATLLPHVWTLLSRPPVTCRLSYGPTRTIERGYDRKHLGRLLAEEIETLLAAAENENRASRARPDGHGSRQSARRSGCKPDRSRESPVRRAVVTPVRPC